METLVLILPKLNVKVNIKKVKEYIHEYVGHRMVKEEPEEMPALVLYDILDEEDKKTIARINEDCRFVFVEYHNIADVEGEFLSIQL